MRTIALRSIPSPFLVSLAVHAAILIAWLVLAMQQATYLREANQQKLTWIEVQEAPRAKADKMPRPEDVRQRVVQTRTVPSSAQVPTEKAFRGEHNQVVDRETVSEISKVGGGAITGPQQAQSHPAFSRTESSQALSNPSVPVLSRLGALQVNQLLKREVAPAPEWAPQTGPGEGAPQEYVQGFEKGQSTALNTREYVFYSYFQRIRQRLDLAWTKQLRSQLERFYRRGRQLASDIDYTTRTLVTLNGDGAVVKVQVLEESGTLDLDQAAVDAFNRAGPFPNPPHGVVDARGLIEIRWDFVVRN